MSRRKSLSFISLLTIGLLLPLGACSNSPWAQQLEQSLAADPQLQTSPTGSPAGSPSPASVTGPAVQLPANFPAEIPRYPGAELIAVTGADQSAVAITGNTPVQTRWQTVDPVERVQQFYRERLQNDGWQLNAADAAPLQADRDGLQVTITTDASQPTQFSIDYLLGTGSATAAAPEAGSSSSNAEALPQPGEPNFIGPVLPDRIAQASPSPAVISGDGSFADLKQAPAELQPYITDLAKLGVLTSGSEFKPNAEVSRRDYARWLVTANNAIYNNQTARKIRLAGAGDQPAFQDVPASDPDFGAIQGLANAGLIPSPLSGDASSTNFRPDAPLTREELILWKVPVDSRQALPNASIDSIQQTWGFQDGAKIDPRAMRAVLADFQNGDLSNIRRAFGYTTLFQPKKTVSRAEAAAVLWQFGTSGNNLSAKDVLQANQSTPTPALAQPSGGAVGP